jgi:hypothetical protein
MQYFSLYTYNTEFLLVVWNSQDIDSTFSFLGISTQYAFLILVFGILSSFMCVNMRVSLQYACVIWQSISYFKNYWTTSLVIMQPYIRQIQSYILRSQWPRGLSRGFAAARLLGLRVRTLPGSLMSVSFVFGVLPGRDLCVGLITRQKESYRVCCVWAWSRILDNKEALAH